METWAWRTKKLLRFFPSSHRPGRFSSGRSISRPDFLDPTICIRGGGRKTEKTKASLSVGHGADFLPFSRVATRRGISAASSGATRRTKKRCRLGELHSIRTWGVEEVSLLGNQKSGVVWSVDVDTRNHGRDGWNGYPRTTLFFLLFFLVAFSSPARARRCSDPSGWWLAGSSRGRGLHVRCTPIILVSSGPRAGTGRGWCMERVGYGIRSPLGRKKPSCDPTHLRRF